MEALDNQHWQKESINNPALVDRYGVTCNHTYYPIEHLG